MTPEVFELNHQVELVHWWFVARRRILRSLILDVVPRSLKSVVVDIGCGTGANIASLANDYRCIGIDPAARAIELAKTRFPEIEFICGKDPEELESVLQDTALIMLNDVLEHVADDRVLLSNWVQAIKPGAYVLLTVPADMSLWSVHDETHGHYRRYDPLGFARLWSDLPLSALLETFFNCRLYPVVKLARFARRLRMRPSGVASTDLQIPSSFINRILQNVFSGEANVLRSILSGKRRRKYPFGVSLIALLQKHA